MTDLTAASVRSWRDLLPDDFKQIVPDTVEGDEDSVGSLWSAVGAAKPAEFYDLIASHADTVRGMGRARRVRLLAWLSGQTHRMNRDVFKRIVDGAEDGDGSGDGAAGGNPVGVLFIEDIRALNDVIAARLARRMVSPDTMSAIRNAALQIGDVPELRPEGM